MAYIFFNGERYFPLRSFDNDIIGLFSDSSSYFEVDELIALPVAALNNKGYLTDMSCSGHGVGDFCCEVADEADINEFRVKGILIAVQDSKEYESNYMCWVGEQFTEIFILFKKPEIFSSIPAGWKYVHNRLSYDLAPTDNPMSVYRQSATALEALMEWIEALPKCNR